MNDKNYRELLSQLLDNELDSVEEAELYRELANNSELRAEFRELLAIKNAILIEKGQIAPPLETTLSLFNKLNIDTGANVVPITQERSSIFRKFLIPAAAVLVLILLTSVVNYYYYKDEIDGKDKIITELKNSQRTKDIKPIPQVSSFENQSIAGAEKSTSYEKVQKPQIKFGQKYDLNFNTSNLNLPPLAIKDTHIEDEAFVINQSQNQNISRRDLLTILNSNIKFEPIDFPLNRAFGLVEPIKGNELKFSTEIRGNISKSYPNIDKVAQNQTFTDYSLGLYFNMNNNHYLGIEGGKEFFTQRFLNIEDGIEMEYVQAPSLYWLGIGYRYSATKFEFLGGGSPFIHLMLGFTELGPLGKTALGLQYNAGGKFSFSLGVEGSILLYENQKVRYDSRKLGLMYGIMYNF